MKTVFTSEHPLVLVGAGKMGGAMLRGWVAAGLDAGIVLDPNPPADIVEFAGQHGVALNPSREHLPAPRALVIAVKPQIIDAVLADIAALAGPETLILSVAAGIPMARYGAAFGEHARIIRAMPNTPAAVGRGITVGYPNARVTAEDRALAQRLLEAVGEVAWITDEADMDAVTALSGSGPAYVFHLVEAMAAAGEAEGLEPGLAMRLARQTVAGSGALLARSEAPAATLRVNVTSPGGTTEAALGVLMGEGGLSPLMARAITAAARRSRDLAG